MKLQEMNRFRIIIEDKRFVKKALAIGVPVALQGLLNTSFSIVDTLMITNLGKTSIAAVSLANKVFFVFALLLFGIVSGSGVLTAQYYGKRDVKNIRRVLGMSLILGVSASILFLIPSLICPEFIMSIFTPNKKIITMGAAYLCVIAISFPMAAITNVYVSLLRGINEVKAPVVISLVAIIVNIILNYILINGYFGAPRLLIVGAAIGTLVSRTVECSAILIYVYLKKGIAAASIKELFDQKMEFIIQFFTTTAPVIANEFMWGLGVTIYAMVYGRMSTEAVAAITLTQNIEQLLVVVFQSISAATAVILGNEMGANKLEKAEKYAKNFIYLQLIFTLMIAFTCFILRKPIISIFHVDQVTSGYINFCLIAFIIYMPFKMFNFVNIVGILRSGGDTKAALVLDCTGVWLIGIPLAVLGGLVLKLPIYYVYAMVMFEEVYKFFLGIRRYRKKIWLRNLVDSQI